MGWKTFKPGRLVCPHCGYDGTSPPEKHHAHDSAPFHWIEDMNVYWPVVAVNNSGTIQMGYDSEYGDESDNPRIECGSCHGEFPVPNGAKSDWVDDDEIDWEGAA
jgi:hypothetical protein